MVTYYQFEDLPVWITAREMANKIYQITKQGEFNKDWGLKNQLRKACVSVMSNIAEGFEHETQALFISYLGRAKASAGEIRCQVTIA